LIKPFWGAASGALAKKPPAVVLFGTGGIRTGMRKSFWMGADKAGKEKEEKICEREQ